MALSADRNTPEKLGKDLVLGVAAAKRCYAGGIACVDASGYATPGATALGIKGVGRFEESVDNTAGGAAAVTVRIRRGIFRWLNSAAGDAIAITDIGETAYIVDDQTVAKTNGPGTRSPAGRIVDVDAQGVWIDTAESIPARVHYLTIYISDVISANAKVARAASPVKGRITKVWNDLFQALTAGNLTLTGKIAAAAITNGVITDLQAGSAAGQVDSATPTAANAVDVGSDINFTVGGGNTAAGFSMITVEITS
jgi:hypothetical protein